MFSLGRVAVFKKKFKRLNNVCAIKQYLDTLTFRPKAHLKAFQLPINIYGFI